MASLIRSLVMYRTVDQYQLVATLNRLRTSARICRRRARWAGVPRRNMGWAKSASPLSLPATTRNSYPRSMSWRSKWSRAAGPVSAHMQKQSSSMSSSGSVQTTFTRIRFRRYRS
ncbi:MAG: hypothetical protein A2Z31_09070 [candidate division NC10 bacterium RBG_16_65_8]|nr:MAG: hypothetical protein A2Z31_09070 [candidate division NC10 bacterium RBG_16_65_8]